MDAFGDRFELELNRNLNLVPNQRPLNIFYADKDKEDIHYMASNEQVIFVSWTKWHKFKQIADRKTVFMVNDPNMYSEPSELTLFQIDTDG